MSKFGLNCRKFAKKYLKLKLIRAGILLKFDNMFDFAYKFIKQKHYNNNLKIDFEMNSMKTHPFHNSTLVAQNKGVIMIIICI